VGQKHPKSRVFILQVAFWQLFDPIFESPVGDFFEDFSLKGFFDSLVGRLHDVNEKVYFYMDYQEALLEQLTSHPFAKKAIKNAVDISLALQKNHASGVEAKYSLARYEYEYYVVEVGHTLAHLVGICEQMIYAVHFLSSFSLTKRMREKGINRSNHILYNVENYLIRTQSLNDRVLKLTNAVFHLEIDQRNCKFDTISKNSHVKITKVPGKLQKISKILEKYRQDRNTVIHHKSYQENDLQNVELLYLVSKSDTDESQNLPNFAYHASRLASKYVKQKSAEFDEFNQLIFKEVLALFDELEKKYIQIETELQLQYAHAP
jgi:hypothetical protein